jgi:hypothetical protein
MKAPASSAEERRLAAALRHHARIGWTGTPADGWRDLTLAALRDAGVRLSDAGRVRACHEALRRGFLCGDSLADARRILRAARDGGGPR